MLNRQAMIREAQTHVLIGLDLWNAGIPEQAREVMGSGNRIPPDSVPEAVY